MLAEVLARTAPDKENPQVIHLVTWGFVCALGGIRTPNLLIRRDLYVVEGSQRQRTSVSLTSAAVDSRKRC